MQQPLEHESSKERRRPLLQPIILIAIFLAAVIAGIMGPIIMTGDKPS